MAIILIALPAVVLVAFGTLLADASKDESVALPQWPVF